MRQAQYLILIILPTALYAAWLAYLYHRARTTGSTEVPALRDGPWFWLILAGIALAAAATMLAVMLEERIPVRDYVPPHLEDGRIVPGGRGAAP